MTQPAGFSVQQVYSSFFLLLLALIVCTTSQMCVWSGAMYNVYSDTVVVVFACSDVLPAVEWVGWRLWSH